MNQNKNRLGLGLLCKFIAGFLLVGALIFGSAGTLAFLNGWMLQVGLMAPMGLFALRLYLRDPDTLMRRLKTREIDPSQRFNIASSGLLFVASFIIAGLDYRFSWTAMPLGVSIVALVIMELSYALFVMVINENAYASRVVEVAKDQPLITTGPYAHVRHPMYTAAILLFISMPLVLGSLYALLPMLLYPAVLVRRIGSEEAMLSQQLAGYDAYRLRVRYRLLPFIW